MSTVIIAVLFTLIIVWLLSLEVRIRKLQPFLSLVDVAGWFVQNFRKANAKVEVDPDHELE